MQKNVGKNAQKRKEAPVEARKSQNNSSKHGNQQELVKEGKLMAEPASREKAAKEVPASTESNLELIKKRRKEMRDKSNNIHIATLAKNVEGSSMKPIKEEKSVLANLDNSKSE